MIYEIDSAVKEKNTYRLNAGKMTVGSISIDELREHWQEMGFDESTVTECTAQNRNLRNSMIEYNDYSFCLFNIVDINNILGTRDRVGLYFRKNMFLVVDAYDRDKSTEALFAECIAAVTADSFCVEKFIYIFFSGLLKKDAKVLESLEIKLNEMENAIDAKKYDESFSRRILQTKKRLLFLHNYYEQLYDIAVQLEKTETGPEREVNKLYFRRLADKAERLSADVHTLRENAVELQSAYQAALEYVLNQTMKFFTVIATIFIPLTFIAGWYGMNFHNMPELSWHYGYYYVIGLSVAVASACIIYFKKKHYF